MDNKKLVIVLGSMGRGGAERVVSILSDYFASKGWKVWILLLLENKVDYVLNNNVKVVDLSGGTASRIKRLPGWIFGIRKTIKEIKPDTVLSFVARINIIVQLALFGLKQKIVVSERNDPYSDGRSFIVDLLTKLLYPKANCVVFQTKRAQGYFDKCKLTNSCIISNPIEVQCKASEPSNGKIVTVGRLSAQKNQKMLIKAFAKIASDFDFAKLHIFGEGELREELTHFAEAHGVGDKVILEGNVINVHERISDAQIFALSSDYEGLSNALLEALMMGLPCVSTDCAGSDEYITDGKNGKIVKVGDADGMADVLKELLLNDNEAKLISNNAVSSSKQFEKYYVLKQWEEVIN